MQNLFDFVRPGFYLEKTVKNKNMVEGGVITARRDVWSIPGNTHHKRETKLFSCHPTEDSLIQLHFWLLSLFLGIVWSELTVLIREQM